MKKSIPNLCIDMVVVTRETVSPRDFLVANKTNPSNIKSATFVAPKIGSKGFGAFEVEYRTPKLVPAE
ncbi:hypothetical protein [Collimonas pratensis]|uniref:hypothetical protein n=1 Tax=Collimonas pratensis TaxID=279113 RepID=UPI000AA2A629|nr:hypothetical protein [Collimonas pratensis]